jgi:HD-GYP domain-containing protein (c-di-GMP phosphodiesterase class II)
MLAVMLSAAAVRTREPRTFFLAAAFLMIASPFSVHGLITPGQMFSAHAFHNSLTISAQLSLFLGAALLLVASQPLPESVGRVIRAHYGLLMVGTVLLAAGYIVLGLARPEFLNWVPTGGERAGMATIFGLDRAAFGGTLRHLAMAAGIGMALLAAFRFYRSFAITRSFATAAVAICLVLIAECLVIQAFGTLWQISWWLYHVMLLIAFVLPMASFALLHRRGSSLIEIVDALLLYETLAKVEYSFPNAIDGFIATVEHRDPYLKGHMRRVCELSIGMAAALKVPDATMRAVSYAALLHDIGKLGLPQTVLNKRSPLSGGEFAVLREHPARGFNLIANVDSLRIAAPAVRWHHERLDGSGYPDGLAGAEIPIEARIVAVADVWDALTSDRVYRARMTTEAAHAMLTAEAGEKLDAACVAALFAVLEHEAPAPVSERARLPQIALAG